jgi:hypothetical protein
MPTLSRAEPGRHGLADVKPFAVLADQAQGALAALIGVQDYA